MSFTIEAEVESIPLNLLSDPLNWLFAEHYRHRQLCGLIDRVVGAVVFDAATIARARDFLMNEMPLHVIDEEEDLFPLLRRRSKPADEIDRILDLLAGEHRQDVASASRIQAHLDAALAAGRVAGLDPDVRRASAAFTAQQRRHIALENAVLLPLARIRLRPADVAALGARLAARRGYLLEDA